MRWLLIVFSTVLVSSALLGPAQAQSFPVEDPILEAIWHEGMNGSEVRTLAQVLADSIGPRLTGSPALEAASDWLIRLYDGWGVEARKEQYGTWRGWRRGPTHIDLLEPRVRTLDGTMLAWSRGTQGLVEGGVVALPDLSGRDALLRWLPNVRDNFVLLSAPEPSCRPASNWQEHGGDRALAEFLERRRAVQLTWTRRVANLGFRGNQRGQLIEMLEEAGALGFLTAYWSTGWGANKVFSLELVFEAGSESVPAIHLSCEDYGLVFRLTENQQSPRVRLSAESEDLGEVPVYNTIAELEGTEYPDEYVILSAHLDTWDGSSGATDNGTGTVMMLEAMRILSQVYPNPKRTILVGHWAGEEQGLNGSRAFASDHPEITENLRALFNQDNGTGAIESISMQGLTEAGAHFGRWLSRIPAELAGEIDLLLPGNPGAGGSDHLAFICSGLPAFNLRAADFDYWAYTWHTDIDTYDKISFRNLRRNATLVAMLAYLASEDDQPIPLDRRINVRSTRDGRRADWLSCAEAERSSGR